MSQVTSRRDVNAYAVAMVAGLCASAWGATTYHVNGACGSDSNSGLSPNCDTSGGPKETIQAGIDATTTEGDIVIVSDGTYTPPDINGYVFTPFQPSENPRNITLKSANGFTRCTIDCQNNGRGFNFNHDSVGSIGPTAIVDGFKMTRGKRSGGAILISQTSPTIRNCWITGNSADGGNGGGILAQKGAAPLIENCLIENNTANEGGGIHMLFALPGGPVGAKITDCVIRGNHATVRGGGIQNHGATDNLLIRRTRIELNTSGGAGGGIAIREADADIGIVNCIITGNQAGAGGTPGGGIAFLGDTGGGSGDSEPQIMNSVISNNKGLTGGGIYVDGFVRIRVANSVLYGNTATATDGGDAIHINSRFVTSTNPASVSNAILWNDPSTGSLLSYTSSEQSALKLEESDVEGTIPSQITSINNISSDPLFIDADGSDNVLGTTDDNFRLQSSSPCLQNGAQGLRRADYGDLDADGDLSELTPRDLDLMARVAGADVEMGAYERTTCTGDGDCTDPTDFCFGDAKCVSGICQITFIADCNGNGREDLCDGGTGFLDCDNDGTLDTCESPAPANVVTSAIYECDDSLPRTQGNVVRLTFKCGLPAPTSSAPVQIRTLAASGGFGGTDLASSFLYQLEGDCQKTVRIKENGAVLANTTWYGVTRGSAWSPAVAQFEMDYVSVFGDANNTSINDFADLSFIYGNYTDSASDQNRSDINANGAVNYSDIETAFTYNGSYAPSKPSGHNCTVP